MRVLLNILFMTSVALCSMYEPSGTTSSEPTGGYIFKNLLVLLFLTPIGWGLAIAIVIGFIMWLGKSVKNVATTDYSLMSEEEKQSQLYAECVETDKENRKISRAYRNSLEGNEDEEGEV